MASPVCLLGGGDDKATFPVEALVPPEDEEMPTLQDSLSELEKAGEDPERLDAALSDVLAAIDALPMFESRPWVCSSLSMGISGRFLTEGFVGALEEASRRVRAVPSADFDDFRDTVAQRFSNSSASRYEHSASEAWPKYAAVCRDLTARFQLAPSGLVTYSLGPYDAPASWELTGEGCWRILPEGGKPTIVTLEMRHGLQGMAPKQDRDVAPVHEPPCTLQVDLSKCARLMLDGSDGNDEDEEYWDDGSEDDEA